MPPLIQESILKYTKKKESLAKQFPWFSLQTPQSLLIPFFNKIKLETKVFISSELKRINKKGRCIYCEENVSTFKDNILKHQQSEKHKNFEVRFNTRKTTTPSHTNKNIDILFEQEISSFNNSQLENNALIQDLANFFASKNIK